MIYQTAVIAAFVSSVSAAAMGPLFTESNQDLRALFAQFKANFRRNYSSEAEENHRFITFVANLKHADDRNVAEFRAGGSAVHGITKYSDWTASEIARLTNANPEFKTASNEVVTEVAAAATTSVDWTGKYTTPVKDQGYCGSCWAFSAVEQIESDAIRTLGYSTPLSPEQFVQCDRTSFGCDGGWTESAYKYAMKNKGVQTDADYPYTSGTAGVTGTCTVDYNKAKIAVKSFTTISGETNMANYVLSTGPLSVCVDASSWSTYKGGIMSTCSKNINHCVQAVGVDTATGGYWKIRNSWGTGWGESGFIRLAYGQNTCGLTNDPTYTVVAKVI